MTHIITRKEFLAYARTRSGKYYYTDNRSCALAQFARDVLGFTTPSCGPGGVNDLYGDGKARYNSIEEIPEKLLSSDDEREETWEALTARLEALA